MKSQFEQIVEVIPAFDKRSKVPSKNYGIGACRIVFVLKGSEGAVQFMLGTNWFLPHTQRENRMQNQAFDIQYNKIQPQGWDVGYHSVKPKYEDQGVMSCPYTTTGTCYYDGSSLRADDWIEPFLSGGTDWLWKKLEQEYIDLFLTKEGEAT